jgi:hypothetical protein
MFSVAVTPVSAKNARPPPERATGLPRRHPESCAVGAAPFDFKGADFA